MSVHGSKQVSLEDEGVRRRLSAPALQAFMETASYLGLTTEDALQLLGGPAAMCTTMTASGVVTP